MEKCLRARKIIGLYAICAFGAAACGDRPPVERGSGNRTAPALASPWTPVTPPAIVPAAVPPAGWRALPSSARAEAILSGLRARLRAVAAGGADDDAAARVGSSPLPAGLAEGFGSVSDRLVPQFGA